ncbi:MAG: ABC-2 family transporter protein, partial [Candidatus Woesearchaeota archaeon]
YIWKAVYSSREVILGYSFSQMITYYVLTMIIGHFIFNMVGTDLQDKIVAGELNQDLLKPFSLINQFLAITSAERLFAFFVEVIPVFIISFLIFKISIPNFLVFFLFFIAIIMAFFLNFFINFFIGIFAFWLYKIESLQWLLFFFIRFASGEFIPLEFFGMFFFNLSKFLPFYYIRYGVIQIYIERFTLIESIKFIGLQIIWLFILIFACKIFLSIAIKKYAGSGG